MLTLEEIETQLNEGKQIEELLEQYNWENFENTIADVFEENGFNTKHNFRFKTKSRFEIDVIATRNKMVFCIDCKWWNKGRYKKSSLKTAIVKQERRLDEFQKFIKKNTIATQMLHISSDSKFYSLVVTLFDEDLIKESKTVVVPVWKLNAFLLEIDNYFI